MTGLLKLLVLVGTGYAVVKAVSPSLPKRDVRTGKSGATWYTETIPGSDPGSVGINVYASPAGNDLVLSYNQVNETGQRFITYTAPSTLGPAATADFI